jgi:hypothetical protein
MRMKFVAHSYTSIIVTAQIIPYFGPSEVRATIRAKLGRPLFLVFIGHYWSEQSVCYRGVNLKGV